MISPSEARRLLRSRRLRGALAGLALLFPALPPLAPAARARARPSAPGRPVPRPGAAAVIQHPSPAPFSVDDLGLIGLLPLLLVAGRRLGGLPVASGTAGPGSHLAGLTMGAAGLRRDQRCGALVDLGITPPGRDHPRRNRLPLPGPAAGHRPAGGCRPADSRVLRAVPALLLASDSGEVPAGFRARAGAGHLAWPPRPDAGAAHGIERRTAVCAGAAGGDTGGGAAGLGRLVRGPGRRSRSVTSSCPRR